MFTPFDECSLSSLVHDLRHPENWNKDFAWDYNDTCRCAMGRAHARWPEKVPSYQGEHDARPRVSFETVASAFGISDEDARHLFGGQQYPGGRWIEQTPAVVADRVEKYILEKV
jgi:hypothetical protein